MVDIVRPFAICESSGYKMDRSDLYLNEKTETGEDKLGQISNAFFNELVAGSMLVLDGGTYVVLHKEYTLIPKAHDQADAIKTRRIIVGEV